MGRGVGYFLASGNNIYLILKKHSFKVPSPFLSFFPSFVYQQALRESGNFPGGLSESPKLRIGVIFSRAAVQERSAKTVTPQIR